MTDIHLDTLKEILAEMNITLTKRQECQFCEYFELLVEWNNNINLTAITDPVDVQIKHFADSLSIVRIGLDFDKMTIADIGTGAGFPGLPLKILFPNMKVVLMDSLDKRVKFLNTVITHLELDRIEAVHGRVEDLAQDSSYREKFDLIVSRAVARMSILSEYCIPFVKVGGHFVAYKSEKAEEELSEAQNAIRVLGGEVERVEQFVLSKTDLQRCLVVVKKTQATNRKYPRKAGTPTKNPL